MMQARCQIAVWLFAAAIAASPAQGDPWLRIDSDHFELLTTAGERNGSELLRYFEQVRSFFIQAFGLNPAPAATARIIAFHSDKEFLPYSPNEVASAFYRHGLGNDYIVMKDASSKNYPIAVHEYTHFLILQSGRTPPLWFNEGLAELYSNLKPAGSQIVVGSVIPSHYQLLLRYNWIPLSELVAVGTGSPLYNEAAHAGLFYAESWALVHMLSLSAEYAPGMRAMIDALKTGDTKAAFQKAYGKSIEQVYDDLITYMRSNHFAAFVYNVQIPAPAGALKVRAGAGFEARMALAELLAASPSPAKRAQAVAAYAELAAESPKDWEVEESLGRLSLLERNPAEAAQHFGRAAQLGCDQPRMYFDYAGILHSQGKAPEAISALKRAIELDSTFQEAQLALGYLLLESGDYQGVLDHFLQVKRVEPAQAFQFFQASAYAHYRLDQTEQARIEVEKALSYVKTPAEAASIRVLVDALNKKADPQAADSRSVRADPLGERRSIPSADPSKAPPPDGIGAQETASRANLAAVEGTLQALDCLGKTALIRVSVNGVAMAFAIVDPAAVTVRAATKPTLTCGPQSPRQIRVEYEPKQDVVPGAAGLVRALELQ
jgi:tetratricopeptide (TPR) repeat protein